MPNLDSTLPKTRHSRITIEKYQSFSPMVIFKIIIDQKLRTLFYLLVVITLILTTWMIYHPIKTKNHQLDVLNQELLNYKNNYQQQLLENQKLQDSLRQQQNHNEQEIQNHELPNEPPIKFKHALATLENKKKIHFPLPAAIEASLFRMIPNDIPVNYQRISSPYGERVHPISGKWKRHLGTDLTCPLGTPIFATADGVVEMTRASNQGYGNLLKIRHGLGFATLYAHLNQFAVKPGQFVEKGDRVGFCGTSGNSTGSHLHYEVRFIGKTLDPQDFMQWQPENIEKLFSQQKYVPWASLIEQVNRTVNLQVLLAMSSKQQAKTSSKVYKKSKKNKVRKSEGLQDFGLDDDGWVTVEE